MSRTPELRLRSRGWSARRWLGFVSLDSLEELLATLSRNKLRTGLTALAVAWGTFLLVVLLAAGKALENGVAWEFRDDAVNSIWLFTGRTSVP